MKTLFPTLVLLIILFFAKKLIAKIFFLGYDLEANTIFDRLNSKIFKNLSFNS